jgi:CheY-like chemotaxis protein
MELVLVVDDQKFDRFLARRILEAHGFSVLEAEDGTEALKICRSSNQPISLVFTDIKMPGMNGLELAEALRLRHPEIKILFTSGYYLPRAGEITDGLLIEKGYSEESLIQKIHQVLNQQPSKISHKS